MLLYILLGAQFAASFVNIICAKKNSDRMCRQTADRALFMIVNAAIACVFFAALNGFVIRLNAITWLYAAGFSLVAAASLLLTLAVYHYAGVGVISVIRTTFGLLATSVLGTLLFSEKPGLTAAVRIGMLMIASVLIYLSQSVGQGKRTRGEKKPEAAWTAGRRLVFIGLMALIVLDGCVSTFLTKSFALRTDVCDANSYYFATNILLLLIGVIWLLIAGRGRIRATLQTFTSHGVTDYLLMILYTVSSNVGSLLAIPLAAMLPVASNTAYGSALGITAAALSSVCFGERQNVFSVLAYLIAIASFLIGLM